MTVSIDGASPETYALYRVKGNFEKVVQNVRKINALKARHHSRFPELSWQFVVFGHNEHEISRARSMAADLNMKFRAKLPWDDLYTQPFSPVVDTDMVRRETGLGVATRGEFRERYGQDYMLRQCCLALWANPQINYDGRLLGCPVNYWGDYGNVFEDGLIPSLNNEKIVYAREMLLGKRPYRDDIPCIRCKAYQRMKKTGRWFSEADIREDRAPRRAIILSENKILGYGPTRWVVKRLVDARRLSRNTVRIMQRGEKADLGYMASMLRSAGKISGPRLASKVYPLDIPLPPDRHLGWKPYPLFRGSAKGIHDLSCHASVLTRKSCPHPPHTHLEEELLLLLGGEVDIILPSVRSSDMNIRLGPGRFVYYPSQFHHTLQTASEGAANYLMLKWSAGAKKRKSELAFGEFTAHAPQEGSEADPGTGFTTSLVFEGPTRFLRKLNCHTSTLTPGAGYEAHADKYEVCIVVLEGEVETIGQPVGPYGVIFYAAGKPHGMRNPGTTVAKYVVFELHPR
jgi:quercetin dioxygenase-like cupin family protein